MLERYCGRMLTNPHDLLKYGVDYLMRQSEDNSHSVKSYLQLYAEKGDPGYLQYAIQKAGNCAGNFDASMWLSELYEFLHDPDFIEAVEALHKQIVKFIHLPPTGQIRKRYDEVMAAFGIDVENLRLPRTKYYEEYGDPFMQFQEEYARYWTFSSAAHTLEMILSAMRADDDVSWSRELQAMVLDRSIAWANRVTDRDLANILDNINSEISGRDTYGLRTHSAFPGDATKLVWSNGSASWHISRTLGTQLLDKHVYKRTRDIRLDANEIIVPYPPEIVEMIQSSLYPLPLYAYSLEGKGAARAKHAGEPLVSDREVKTMIKSVYTQAFDEGSSLFKYMLDGDWAMFTKFKSESFDETELVAYLDDRVRYGVVYPDSFKARIINWFLNRAM